MRARSDLHSVSGKPHSGDVIYFTDKQKLVLTRVCEGWTNATIAHQLECTEVAVKGVIQQLFKKLGVRKRSQIVRIAFETHMLSAGRDVKMRGNTTGQRQGGGMTVPEQSLQVGDFVIDVAKHQVWIRGIETTLTPTEFQLLWYFAAHAGQLIKSSTLREMFWRNPTSKEGSLRVLVGALRAKIENTKIPRYVVTVRSLGYRFVSSPSQSDANQRNGAPAPHLSAQ